MDRMKVADILAQVDSAVISSATNGFYLTGLYNPDAIILLTNSDAFYITDARYEFAVNESLPKDFQKIILGAKEQVDFIKTKLANCNKIGFEFDDITLAKFNTFDIGCANAVDISDSFQKQRIIKSASELKIIAKAESIVDKTFESVLNYIKEGVSEKDVAFKLESLMREFGADDVAFDTIVAFGENSAKPHAVPSDRLLKKGDAILMDFGAKYQGYCSDFTRTLYCGSPDDKFQTAYKTVLNAQLDAIKYIINGGRDCLKVDSIAREVIDSSAFVGTFTHSLGHGVGIKIHEKPTLSKNSKDFLSDGMIFTIEPGIYIEGQFGIRIESLVALIDGKLAVLDRSNKEIITV